MEKKNVNEFDMYNLKVGIDFLKKDFSEFNQEILFGAISRINEINSEVLSAFLSELKDNGNRWNADLSRYTWSGKLIEFNAEDVVKELWLKKDAIILCGHVSKVYENQDAYCIHILEGDMIVDICEDCFSKLVTNNLYTPDDKEFESIKGRYSKEFKSSYIWDGNMIQLQIALESVK